MKKLLHECYRNYRNYPPILAYMMLAFLIRAAVWAPVAVLWVTHAGRAVRWIAFLCPILATLLILPLRMTFAASILTTIFGFPFRILQTLSFEEEYPFELLAGLRQALYIALWSLPLLMLAWWLYWLVALTDAASALHTLADIGAATTGVLTGIDNFFAGLFGGSGIGWDGGIIDGLHTVVGYAALAVLLLIWGVWRLSPCRYIYAFSYYASDTPSYPSVRSVLYGHRKQWCLIGLTNLALWFPSLLFTAFGLLCIRTQIAKLVTTFFYTKTFPAVAFSTHAIRALKHRQGTLY